MIHDFFGFHSPVEFAHSLIRPKLITNMKTISLSMAIAAFALTMEWAFGVPVAVVASFVGLNVMEWLTGIFAAKAKGQVTESKKLGRALLKTFVYLIVLFMLNQMKSADKGQPMWYMITWTYWFLFVGISIILVRSIFENLHIMGVKEAATIHGILNNKYTAFLGELTSPPSEEKKNR